MQHIPKQSYYVRCPALKLLCTNLRGPLTKKFGDPCTRLRMFKIVFGESSLYPKQLSLFCLLRLISASAGRIGCIRHTNFCTVIELLHELKNSSC